MTKNKILVTISCVMMVIGLIIYGIGYSIGGRLVGLSINNHGVNLNVFDFNRTITSVVEKEDTLDSFTGINIAFDYGEVNIIPSDHFGIFYKTNIYNSNNNNATLNYEVRDNTLHLSTSSYSTFNFTVFGSSVQNTIEHFVVIYVPEDTALDFINANMDSGVIGCKDLEVETVDVKAKYGALYFSNLDIVTANLTLPTEDGYIKDCSFDTLTLNAEYDDFYLDNVQVTQKANFKLNTMRLEVSNSNFNDLTYNADYGSLKMKNVEVAGKVSMDNNSVKFDLSDSKFQTFDYKSEYGNVDIDNCSAIDIIAKTDSTKITMAELVSNTLNLNSKYGSVNMDNCSIEEITTKCDSTKMDLGQLTASTIKMDSKYGNIKLQPVAPIEDYFYDITTKYGKLSIGGNKLDSGYKTLINESLTKSITIDGDSCDIDIYN